MPEDEFIRNNSLLFGEETDGTETVLLVEDDGNELGILQIVGEDPDA